MDQNSFFVDAIDHEAIKIELTFIIRKASLAKIRMLETIQSFLKQYVIEAYLRNSAFLLLEEIRSFLFAPSLTVAPALVYIISYFLTRIFKISLPSAVGI